MIDKVLCRRTKDGQVVLFVPSRPAVKGYVKQWTGANDFVDVSLDAYRTTTDCSEQETKNKVKEYLKATGIEDVVISLRLPKDYQKHGQFNDYALKPVGHSFVIEDVHGKFIVAYTNQEQALHAMDRLKQGKNL